MEVGWIIVAVLWVATAVMHIRDNGRTNDRIDREVRLASATRNIVTELHMNQGHLIAALTAQGSLNPEAADNLMILLQSQHSSYHEQIKEAFGDY